jgi:hypothetical protein
VLADTDRVGHGGEGRVHRPDAGEDACVDGVQVVELLLPFVLGYQTWAY